MEKKYLHYLEGLSDLYPTISRASAEIINLQAILNLPKSTEHFMSDIHGEFGAFSHVLRNGSGAVRKKIDDVFGTSLSEKDKCELATLIYYPKEKTELIKSNTQDIRAWYRTVLYRLIEVCRIVSSKYTRSKVRKALPKDYAYIIEELITEKAEILNKEAYYDSIVNTVVELGRAPQFIIALANLIQRLCIDKLHIIGDIYDRGSGAHLIMDRLCDYHSVDFQWGNHDIIWMGAAAGQPACVATVIRNNIRYGNIDSLEEGYGINMLPLATFALRTYESDGCECFRLKNAEHKLSDNDTSLNKKMHKAITVIKFKLEGQLIKKHPEFGMDDRLLLEKINYNKGTVTIDGKEYELLDKSFPTVDPADPYKLSQEEEEVISRLRTSFIHCEKLQKHTELLLKNGSMYKVCNNNLLYHGCVPMNSDGSFKSVNIYGKYYSGKALFDVLETYVRKAFFSKDTVQRELGVDIMWYIWTSPDSPLFGRDKMATFERYFIADKTLWAEPKNAYYKLIDKPQIADKILKDFGLTGDYVHIINGHMPVHRMQGESPVKSGGKVIVIDGGFSSSYRNTTGIAGYTLIYNSYGLTLTAHEPFVSHREAVRDAVDIVSRREAVELMPARMLVRDTDDGKKIQEKIDDIKELIEAYENGEIAEHK